MMKNLSSWPVLLKYGVAICIFGVVSILLMACSASVDDDVDSPPDISVKGHAKLDSQLNQLVTADKRGEAESFAAESAIEIIDGNVRVIIECLPGRLAETSETASGLGAIVESSHEDLLQAVIPINLITTLADEESVRLIRLPFPIEPANGDNIKE